MGVHRLACEGVKAKKSAGESTCNEEFARDEHRRQALVTRSGDEELTAAAKEEATRSDEHSRDSFSEWLSSMMLHLNCIASMSFCLNACKRAAAVGTKNSFASGRGTARMMKNMKNDRNVMLWGSCKQSVWMKGRRRVADVTIALKRVVLKGADINT